MSLREQLGRPVDILSLAVFRVLFGLIMAAGTARFLLSGWVEELFVRPTFFFKYNGFEWVPVWEPIGLYLHFGVVLAAALCVAVGLFYRWSLAVFIVGFTGIQLMDQTNYLNHYYLVILLSCVMLILPANRALSLDVWRTPTLSSETAPAWTIYLLRFQVALVYIFAAVAKTGADWLWHAQPLSIWLSARTDLPLLGSLFAEPWMAFAMSWGGLIYDATIVGFLLWARTRALAYMGVIIFHAMTWALFDIGMFPVIMVVVTTIFFEPDWPRRLLKLAPKSYPPVSQPLSVPLSVVIAVWCALHLLVPLRHYAHSGDVLWNEVGMRYSWKVMVREKMGSITYRVSRIEDGREWQVNPASYLEPRQLSEMSSQPDMIVQLAHHIRNDFITKGRGDVAVSVDALASLNGRPPARLIDPDVDLTRLSRPLQRYILPLPKTPPLNPWARDGSRTN